MDAICFIDQNFLSATPLTPQNVLEYFSRSPFYDSTCNNEVIKMQNQYRGIASSKGHDKMHGMYYSVEDHDEACTLFIIRQSINKDDNHTNINFYYVMYGHVYEAPTTQMVYKTRINEVFWYLNKILDRFIETDFFQSSTFTTEEDEDVIPEQVRKDIYEEFKKGI